MGGFLQSLKFQDKEMQKYICTLVGKKAKFKGAKKNWKKDTKGKNKISETVLTKQEFISRLTRIRVRLQE